ARVANTSRSAFAARFKAKLGEAPLEYLTRWRMFRAGVLLRNTERSLASIANEVGYESDAALSKAFHRVVGMAPGAFRKQRADALFAVLVALPPFLLRRRRGRLQPWLDRGILRVEIGQVGHQVLDHRLMR